MNRLRTSVLYWSAALALLAVLVCLVFYVDGRVDRELRSMSALDRRALYQRTLEVLRSSCLHVRGPQLTDYCCEQAQFIARFPECDSACRELAHKLAPKPTHGLR